MTIAGEGSGFEISTMLLISSSYYPKKPKSPLFLLLLGGELGISGFLTMDSSTLGLYSDSSKEALSAFGKSTSTSTCSFMLPISTFSGTGLFALGAELFAWFYGSLTKLVFFYFLLT